MKISLKKFTIAALVLIAPAFIATNAQAVPVDVELALVIDTSGSVDAAEFILQRDGYAAAFNSASVQDAIDDSTNGVAVAVYFFDSVASATSISWTHLQSAADAGTFATALMGLADPTNGATNIASGMDMGVAGILGNAFEGDRLVMDVSGDGIQNVAFGGSGGCGGTCTDLVDLERDQAAAAEITVNGLAIIDDFANLATYYSDHVATNDGFVLTATFDTFSTAVQRKIFSEITDTDIPAPATLLLMGLGLVGMGMRRRKTA